MAATGFLPYGYRFGCPEELRQAACRCWKGVGWGGGGELRPSWSRDVPTLGTTGSGAVRGHCARPVLGSVGGEEQVRLSGTLRCRPMRRSGRTYLW